MPKYEVKTVLAVINRGGIGGLYHCDLVFVNNKPVLVIEWSGERGSSRPSHFVKLDPKALQAPPPGKSDYVYQLPIEDPRKLQ